MLSPQPPGASPSLTPTPSPSPSSPSATPAGPSRPGADWSRLHLWQIQPLRDALVILSLFALLRLGYTLSVVTVPILLALALSYLFEPLVARLTAGGLIRRPTAAVLIIVVTAFLILAPLGVGVCFGVIQGVESAQRLTDNIVVLRRSIDQPDDPALYERLPTGAWRRTRDYLVRVEQESESGETPRTPTQAEGSGGGGRDVGDGRTGAVRSLDRLKREAAAFTLGWLRANSDSIASAVGRRALGTGAGAIKGVIGTVTSIGYALFAGFLTAFFFFFFSTSLAAVSRFWKGLIPDRHRERVVGLVGKMDRVIAAFVRGRITIALTLALIYTGGYWLIGVPAPLIVGPLVGLLSLAPYLSGVLGMPGAMLLMLLSPSSIDWQTNWWWILFAPIGVSLIGQALDDYLLTPMIQGKGTDMNMPTMLFASIAGGVLGGFYGVLLAIPAAACLKILGADLVWPVFKDWAEGRTRDPLPIGRGEEGG